MSDIKKGQAGTPRNIKISKQRKKTDMILEELESNYE